MAVAGGRVGPRILRRYASLTGDCRQTDDILGQREPYECMNDDVLSD